MTYRLQFQVIWDNWELLIEGVGLTLQLSALAIGLGLMVGIVGALFRTSNNQYLQGLMAVYIEAIRNTPFLVQLLFIFLVFLV
ncbi:MAG: ABC transporter permease subunit [Leptolyngbyaceae cyanobacterium]